MQLLLPFSADSLSLSLSLSLFPDAPPASTHEGQRPGFAMNSICSGNTTTKSKTTTTTTLVEKREQKKEQERTLPFNVCSITLEPLSLIFIECENQNCLRCFALSISLCLVPFSRFSTDAFSVFSDTKLMSHSQAMLDWCFSILYIMLVANASPRTNSAFRSTISNVLGNFYSQNRKQSGRVYLEKLENFVVVTWWNATFSLEVIPFGWRALEYPVWKIVSNSRWGSIVYGRSQFSGWITF